MVRIPSESGDNSGPEPISEIIARLTGELPGKIDITEELTRQQAVRRVDIQKALQDAQEVRAHLIAETEAGRPIDPGIMRLSGEILLERQAEVNEIQAAAQIIRIQPPDGPPQE